MKKLLLFALIVAMASFEAKAEYLYWQVNDDSYGTGTYYAELYRSDSATYGTGSALPDSSVYRGVLPMGNAVSADISGYTDGYYYYVEVWTYTVSEESGITLGESKGHSAVLSYSDLERINAIATSREWSQSTLSTLGLSLAAWNATNVVPEPTSGLLTMIGLALLGLKRRRI